MKKQLIPMFILSIILIVFSTTSVAGGAYVGATGGIVDIDGVDFNAVQLVAGIQANEWIGAEVRYGRGVGDESYQGVKVELDSYYGLYGTLTIPVGDSVNPYIIAGRTWGTVDASYNGYSASASESDVSIGAGVRFSVRESFIVGVEYMKPIEDVESLTLSFIFPIK